jgi:chitodextrinase
MVADVVRDRRTSPVMSKTGSEHHPNEGFSRRQRRPTHRKIMFGSRRQLVAAAGFWVLLVAAAAAISIIPGATAAVSTPVFSDGFESGNLSQWTRSSGMTVQRQVTYTGSWAARATTSGTPGYAYKSLSTPQSELYYGGRFQAIRQGATNVSLVRFRTAAGGLILSLFRRGSDNKLSYYNEVTGVSTVGPVMTAGAWHELKVHVLVNGTSSLVEVWLDGTRVINKTAESLGTTAVGRIYIGEPSTGKTFDYAFDDEVVSAADSTPPSNPTGLTMTGATTGSIALRWNASSDNVGVLGYDLFLNGSKIRTTSGTNYTFSGLACGTTYALGVDAFDAAGNTSSQASVTGSAASCGGVVASDVGGPSTPTALTVTDASPSTVSLSWNASTDSVGVAGYDAFRDNSRVGTTNTTTYTFTGLSCGTTYALGVDAFDGGGNVSGRASITAASSPCGGDVFHLLPTELLFPGITGAPGTTLPERGCNDPSPSPNCAQEGGFTRSDYQGSSILNGVNERERWVADPTGSGKTVAQLEVYGDDSADLNGGTRTTLYENNGTANCNGCEAWFVYGYYIPVGFQYPDQWFALMQNFSPSRPIQTIELRGAGCASAAPRNHICFGDRPTPSNDYATYKDLGPVNEGHWMYIVAHIKFSNTATGSIQVWRSDDKLPDVSQPPIEDREGILTLYSGIDGSASHLFLYRGASTHSEHQIVDVCGFHRAADYATAKVLPNCPA